MLTSIGVFIARTGSKCGRFVIWSYIWSWRSRTIAPQNDSYLEQGRLHIWSTFGDPSFNGWCVIVRTNSWLTHIRTDRQTDTSNAISGGQNWPRVKIVIYTEIYMIIICFKDRWDACSYTSYVSWPSKINTENQSKICLMSASIKSLRLIRLKH